MQQFIRERVELTTQWKVKSQDFITANFWNVGQYAILTHMVARHSGLKVGKLTHVIGDCHIYNKHEEIAEELISREPMQAAELWVNPAIKDFYEFTEDDFELVNYEHHPQIKGIDVAI